MKTISKNIHDSIRQITADALEFKSAAGGAVAEPAAGWLTAHYIAEARETLDATEATRRWELLRTMVRDVSHLRRNEIAAARLELTRKSLDLRRLKSQARKENEVQESLQPGAPVVEGNSGL